MCDCKSVTRAQNAAKRGSIFEPTIGHTALTGALEGGAACPSGACGNDCASDPPLSARIAFREGLRGISVDAAAGRGYNANSMTLVVHRRVALAVAIAASTG